MFGKSSRHSRLFFRLKYKGHVCSKEDFLPLLPPPAMEEAEILKFQKLVFRYLNVNQRQFKIYYMKQYYKSRWFFTIPAFLAFTNIVFSLLRRPFKNTFAHNDITETIIPDNCFVWTFAQKITNWHQFLNERICFKNFWKKNDICKKNQNKNLRYV